MRLLYGGVLFVLGYLAYFSLKSVLPTHYSINFQDNQHYNTSLRDIFPLPGFKGFCCDAAGL